MEAVVFRQLSVIVAQSDVVDFTLGGPHCIDLELRLVSVMVDVDLVSALLLHLPVLVPMVAVFFRAGISSKATRISAWSLGSVLTLAFFMARAVVLAVSTALLPGTPFLAARARANLSGSIPDDHNVRLVGASVRPLSRVGSQNWTSPRVMSWYFGVDVPAFVVGVKTSWISTSFGDRTTGFVARPYWQKGSVQGRLAPKL